MIDFSRYALFDRARTMRLSLEALPRESLIADIPGELAVASPILAAMLGIERLTEEVMLARSDEFAALDEETAFRLWTSPAASADGRTVFISAPDALPEMDGTPDWGIASAGFLIGSAEEMLRWAGSLTGAETTEGMRLELSKILSGTCEPPHAAVLTDLVQGTEIMRWPVKCGNPIRALSAAAAQWPEVRYAEDDFRFTLREDMAGA